MRLLTKILLILIVLITAVLTCSVIYANRILNHYKGDLERIISTKLKTPVTFDSIYISPADNFRVIISAPQIKQENNSSLVSAKSISATFDISALLSRKIILTSANILELKSSLPAQAGRIEASFNKLDISDPAINQIEAQIWINDFSATDGKEKYRLKSADGSLDVKNMNGTLKLASDLNIKGFEFNDGETSIRNVNGKLKNLKASIGSDCIVSMFLDADSILLQHPSIVISGVESVTSPIKISIPAKGGYKVSGPVKIRNAAISTIGKEFKQTSSEIKMLVSSPLKDFETEEISFQLKGKSRILKTHFAMTANEYVIDKTSLRTETGTINANTRIKRGKANSMAGQASIQNLNLSELMSLATNTDNENYSGRIREFNCDFSAKPRQFAESLNSKGNFILENFTLNKKNVVEELILAAEKVPSDKPFDLPIDKGSLQISGNFKIENQEVTLDKVLMPTKYSTIEANGKVGFNKKAEFKIEVIFLKDTFEALGMDIKPLKSFFGKIGKIQVPLNANGTLPDIDLKVNQTEWLKRVSGINIVTGIFGSVRDTGKSIIGIGQKKDKLH